MLKRLHLSIAVLLLSGTVSAQAPATAVPRTPDGKPDFSGVWQTGGISLSGTQANVVAAAPAAPAPAAPGGGGAAAKPSGEYAALPTQPSLQPWAAEKVKGLTAKDDPTVRCFMPGVPRAFTMPMPFEIVQTPKQIVILYEAFRAFRIIPIDGRKPVGETLPGYMGDANGRWEGDTLVVEVKNFNGQIWGPGNMRVTSDAYQVTERYTHRGDTIAYEARIEDPKVLTGPFVFRTTMRRPPETRVAEYECLEGNNDIPHLVGQ
ncbi:MAG TPA: hypothetical protein VM818_06155 [Vicinamibacterales bacterium]|nr:hypothetical protein [Vicinamibacterales bacterium]